MPYEVCIISVGEFSLGHGDELKARCTSTLLKGKKKVVVNTMTIWDDENILNGMKRCGVAPKDVDYIVCTNGGSCYTGNNHMFMDSIRIIGNSIHNRNICLRNPLSEGKPYEIDGDDLIVIPTPGHSLSDVSVIVKTAEGVVAVTGGLFLKHEDIRNDACWLSSHSECPILQRTNREIILNMVNHIVPGYGSKFEVTPEVKKSFYEPRVRFQPNKEVMAKVGVC